MANAAQDRSLIPGSEDINSVITVNLVAPIYLSRALVRHWLGLPASVTAGAGAGSGESKRDQKVNLNKRILMISSISGLVNMTPQKQVAYNASKGGLTMAAKVRLPPLWQVLGGRAGLILASRWLVNGRLMVFPSTVFPPGMSSQSHTTLVLVSQRLIGAQIRRDRNDYLAHG